jgi:hypothetical protein
MSNGLTSGQKTTEALAIANMNPDQREAYQDQLTKQGRQSALLSGGAGLYDVISGKKKQKDAEGEIETLGAEADKIREQMKKSKVPGATDPETVAAAVRNAAILGSGKQRDDSSELAAAKMAMESGADPSQIQSALSKATQEKDEAEEAEKSGLMREGLGSAREQAMQQYQKDMADMGMDYDESQAALQQAQQESLLGQQQAQAGTRNLISGASQLLANPRSEEQQAEAKEKRQDFFDKAKDFFQTDRGELREDKKFAEEQGLDPTEFVEEEGFEFPDEDPPVEDLSEGFAKGGRVVQKTPGAFKHDDGDGVYEKGENELILMAQKSGGLVDTGIRQTGGEFVINPKQARGMEKAYEKVKKKKNPSKADLMSLFNAVRFLDEPQFD